MICLGETNAYRIARGWCLPREQGEKAMAAKRTAKCMYAELSAHPALFSNRVPGVKAAVFFSFIYSAVKGIQS